MIHKRRCRLLFLAQVFIVLAVSSFIILDAFLGNPLNISGSTGDFLLKLCAWLWIGSALVGFYLFVAARREFRIFAWTAAILSFLQCTLAVFSLYTLFYTSTGYSTRDEIVFELANIANKANHYRRLSSMMGGGNGSYIGFEMPKLRADAKDGFSFRFVAVAPDSIIVEGRYEGKENGTIRALIDSGASPRNWEYFGDYR